MRVRGQGRLEDGKNIPRLEARAHGEARSGEKRFYKSRTDRKGVIMKRWLAVYTVTTVSTVIAVILLLVFGVSAENRSFSETLTGSALTDRIAELFVRLDFPSLSGSDSDKKDGSLSVDAPKKDTAGTDDTAADSKGDTVQTGTAGGGLYDFDYSKIPSGYTPIVPMDLSLSSYGPSYINNSTGYTPDVPSLLAKDLKKSNGYEQLTVSSSPLVLIIHTHGTEGYSENGATYYSEEQTDYARTSDTSKNVVSVGRTVAELLNKSGIPTAHCTVMHDSVQYKSSYARAEETVKKYLEEYPSIKLVIDIHRDAIVKSSGELVRPVAELDGEAAAQVMCVVGSSWEGDECPNWENNLSLALKLRELLNGECSNICRPVNLKAHTYNQELAPYSLLLEVGSSGNSLEEAQRTAALIGKKLAELVKMI